MEKHTATPWRISPDTPNKIICDQINGFDPISGENVIGGTMRNHPDAEANAAFMVRACNAHEELVETLKECDSKLILATKGQLEYTSTLALVERIRAALEKAR